MTSIFDGIRVIDADTHLTEPHDLWVSRAPAEYRDRVPQVHEVDGMPTWVFDGVILARAGAAGVVNTAGLKVPGTDFLRWTIDDVHRGAHSVPDRLAMMDEQGIWAQIVYPNTVGFGGQNFGKVKDAALRRMAVEIYNDAMAEIQQESGGRLNPMGVMPFWDIDLAVREIERIAYLGLHGLNTTSAPHEHGLPDFGDVCWNPVWEAASGLGLPVNFHIGASASDMDWHGSVPWPSLDLEMKMGLGSAMLYVHNAGVIANMIYTGVLERHPTLQLVSVESGVGWLPFMLQALDHQINEMAHSSTKHLTMPPSEYFRRQFHACFWFERTGIPEAIAAIGGEHLMFETDFPHPTCTFPDALDYAAEALKDVTDPKIRQCLMGGNAARLYGIEVPDNAPSASSDIGTATAP